MKVIYNFILDSKQNIVSNSGFKNYNFRNMTCGDAVVYVDFWNLFLKI